MLFSNLKNTWTENGSFFEIPELKTDHRGIIHGGMRLETSEGLFDIKEVDEVLYREDKLNFRSGTWYLLCTTYTDLQFKIEL